MTPSDNACGDSENNCGLPTGKAHTFCAGAFQCGERRRFRKLPTARRRMRSPQSGELAGLAAASDRNRSIDAAMARAVFSGESGAITAACASGQQRKSSAGPPRIKAHHWSAKGQCFGYGEPRLVMKGRVEKHASGGDRSEKFGTVHTTFEPHSVGDTPSMRSARNPPLFRALTKDAQHRGRVSNVA